MNNRIAAFIFTFLTISGTCLHAQIEEFGFKFIDSKNYTYYPVTVYSYKDHEWKDTSESRVKQCLVGQDLYCEYVSPEQSISLKLNPDGYVYTLPDIFKEFYMLHPDYAYDDIKTSGLAIMYKSDQLPEYNY